MSKLTLNSIPFQAFSGQGKYRNNPRYQCMVNLGPIPRGKYYVVDRPVGGRLGPLVDYIRGRDEWFGLFADDGSVDDQTFCMSVERGNFRLHPKGLRGTSEGCVTLERRSDFTFVRNILLGAQKFKAPGTELDAYGMLLVI